MQSGPAGASVCYLIQSHREPELVGRLASVLTSEDPHCSVVVRHDASQVPLDGAVVTSDRVRVTQSRTHARWGSWAQTSASLEGVREALELPWDWLVLLTGQSYPLQPPASYAQHLARTDAEGIFDFSRGGRGSEGGLWTHRPFGADRARYRFYDVPHCFLWDRRLVRKALGSLTGRQPFVGAGFHSRGGSPGRAQAHVLVYAPRSPFARGVVPLQAGQCWSLRRHRATELLDLLDARSPWNKHFRHSFTSDELVIPSFIADRGADVDDEVLHAQRWPSGASPQTLTIDDVPWIASQDPPFVRKVSLVDGPGVVDRIDRLRLADAASDRGYVR